ncbi:hypothetical protein CKF46_37110, partial [Klebsiella pneumoniae]
MRGSSRWSRRWVLPISQLRRSAFRDLLAVDTAVPVSVTGGLAGEFSLEQAVG